MDYMTQLPIDLFAPIIFLSFGTLSPGDRIIRTEELRLVSKAWQVAIDSSPCFWTCIPYQPTPRISSQEIQRWIRKSGEAPLHIFFDTYYTHGVFMPFIVPFIHRWRSLALNGRYFDISKYLNEPAPMLRRLLISETSLTSDSITFGGVTPSLSSVELVYVTIAGDLCFLKNLKELRLSRITYDLGDAAVNKLGDILNACPELERLELDENHSLCRPVLLSKLSSFTFIESQKLFEHTETIFGMITAPRLSHSYLEIQGNWMPRHLRVLSPLSSELLRNHSEYNIIISYNYFVLSTTSREEGLQPLSSVTVKTWSEAHAYETSLKLLKDFEKAAPLSAPVDLVLDVSRPAKLVTEYLKSTKESTSGISDNPLPQLRSIQSSQQTYERSSSFDTELINLARARRNTPKITIHSGGVWDDRVNPVSQLDPESFSFVPVG